MRLLDQRNKDIERPTTNTDRGSVFFQEARRWKKLEGAECDSLFTIAIVLPVIPSSKNAVVRRFA